MENETQIVKTEQQASPLMNIISAASTNGEVDADKLLKLIEASERFDANVARKAYVKAMAAFQANAPKIVKDAKGHNSGYTKLSTVISIVAPKLSEQGLSHSWVTEQDGKTIKVFCKITHEQGHSEKTYLSAEADTSGSKNSIQALGSTVTYLKRYTLEAALGLAEAEQGDDGAGSDGDPNAMPERTPDEVAVLAAIYCQMVDTASENGTILDKTKLGKMLFGLKGYHQNEMGKVGTVVAYLINRLTENDSWHIVAKV
jgi:hypothetical protein